MGSLVGSLKECLEAVELVREGVVRPEIQIWEFRELGEVYEGVERGDVAGRVALRVGRSALSTQALISAELDGDLL